MSDMLHIYLSKISVSKTFKFYCVYCDVRLQYPCYFRISLQEAGYFLQARNPFLMLILISSHVEPNMQNLRLKEYCVSRSDVIWLPLKTVQHITFYSLHKVIYRRVVVLVRKKKFHNVTADRIIFGFSCPRENEVEKFAAEV